MAASGTIATVGRPSAFTGTPCARAAAAAGGLVAGELATAQSLRCNCPGPSVFECLGGEGLRRSDGGCCTKASDHG
eukprot:3092972-Lingulodinium_polyedra.AAC.1